MTRVLASVGGLMYSKSEDTIFVHQYMQSTATVDGGQISQETTYPNNGTVQFTVKGLQGKKIAMRIPSWCKRYDMDGAEPTTEKGYAYVDVTSDEFVFTLKMDMMPMWYEASPIWAK